MEEVQPKFIKLKTIKKDSVVKLEISAGYYVRMQELLAFHVNSQPSEVGILALEELKTKEPKDKFQYHLLTILSFLHSADDAFEEAKLIEESDVEVPKSV